MQDAFRARVLFPIFNENGEPVGVGGRILPGSTDPAKYKNSPETPIYTKSKTLYGLNWAKGDIVAADQAIVCEGYTDVIGFHRAGLPRAVATCGTAFTEEHVRLLKRYASRVVLAFDADAAGQGAAERFYEWEQKYQVEVSVARFPGGKDPGELAQSDPGRPRRRRSASALPFLGFRLDRVLQGQSPQSPEQRARLGEVAMTVINEHPNSNVRKLYAGQVAAQVGLPVADLVQLAERGTRRPQVHVSTARSRRGPRENAEFVAITQLVQDWDSIAPWLVESLFADELYRRAFLAIAAASGDLGAALEQADPEAREVLERAAVVDLEVDAEAEARNLIARRRAARARPDGVDERSGARAGRSRGTPATRGPGCTGTRGRCGGLVASLAGGPNGRTLMGGADALDSDGRPTTGWGRPGWSGSGWSCAGASSASSPPRTSPMCCAASS